MFCFKNRKTQPPGLMDSTCGTRSGGGVWPETPGVGWSNDHSGGISSSWCRTTPCWDPRTYANTGARGGWTFRRVEVFRKIAAGDGDGVKERLKRWDGPCAAIKVEAVLKWQQHPAYIVRMLSLDILQASPFVHVPPLPWHTRNYYINHR